MTVYLLRERAQTARASSRRRVLMHVGVVLIMPLILAYTGWSY